MMEDDHWRKRTFDGRQPLTEEDLWRKTTFDGRRPLMEEDLWRKTTIDGRRPLTEDDLWRQTTFDGRRPFTEDDLWRKMTFNGRWPLTEDDLWRKTTFNGRRLLIGCIIFYLKKCLWLLHLTATAQLTPNRKSYQLSKPEIEFHVMEEIYAASHMRKCAERRHFEAKTTKHPLCILHHASCIMHHASCIINHASFRKNMKPPSLKKIM